MFSEQRVLQIEEKFSKLIPVLGDKEEEILGGLKGCSEEEQLAIKFLYTTMPLSDLACYSFNIFLDYARHGVYLWEKNAWHIPEDIFLNYVLHHRINEEEMMPCRSYFYSQLKDRVEGKGNKEAILEVNYWCSEEATYQSTDVRTVAPLTVYKSAYGRCGEESTFTVSALRSVGIPARQVYAPRWSHCDDNHAWVEVWCEGEWYFLGACEPEEILNAGWFTSASSRAMLIHSRWFDFMEPSEEQIEHKGRAVLLNHLHNYALTKKVTIQVVNGKGEVIPQVRVDFEVLNYSEFYPIASILTNKKGEVTLTTGLGSLHIHVSKDDFYVDTLIDTKEVDYFTINLNKEIIKEQWIEYEVSAPLDAPIHVTQPTLSQKIRGKEKFREATEKRLQKVAKFYNEDEILNTARGNAKEILDFKLETIQEGVDIWKERLLAVLTQKDYRDCQKDVLIEHLSYALPYAKCYEESLFTKYILNPRVEMEPLTAYRKFIDSYYTKEEKAKMTQNPKYIWKYIEETIKVDETLEYSNLITTPVGCLKVKGGSERSKKILFVAICRTLGIPARLNSMDGRMEYYNNGAFVAVEEEVLKNSKCILKSSKENTWTYFQNWSIAKLQKGQYQSLGLTEVKWEDTGLSLNLEQGNYRIITSNRLPNGNIFTKVMYLTLKENESKEVQLALKEAKLSEMLEQIALVDFELRTKDSQVINAANLVNNSKYLWIWIEESKEPTEHILNEMYEKRECFKAIEKQIIFIIKEERALEDPTFKKVLKVLDGSSIYYDDFEENVNKLARRMYVDPGKLPLIIVTENKMEGIYATSGYNVGTADMLLRIFKN